MGDALFRLGEHVCLSVCLCLTASRGKSVAYSPQAWPRLETAHYKYKARCRPLLPSAAALLTTCVSSTISPPLRGWPLAPPSRTTRACVGPWPSE